MPVVLGKWAQASNPLGWFDGMPDFWQADGPRNGVPGNSSPWFATVCGPTERNLHSPSWVAELCIAGAATLESPGHENDAFLTRALSKAEPALLLVVCVRVVRLRASTRRFLPPWLALCKSGSVWSRPVALHRELGCRGYPRLLGVRAPASL